MITTVVVGDEEPAVALVVYGVVLVLLVVGCAVLSLWLRRRSREWEPTTSTLSDEERVRAQLGIALTAGNTTWGAH